MSSLSVDVQTQVTEELRALEAQKAPWGVNPWHCSSIGSTSGGSTLARITIRKHIILSKGEENKNKYITRKQTREKESLFKDKGKEAKVKMQSEGGEAKL